MTSLIDSIFGTPEVDKVEANIEKQKVETQALLHEANPDLPGPEQLPAPEAKGNFWSDVTGGVLGTNNSHIRKAYDNEVSKLKAASGQGKISPDTLLTRLATVSSKYQSMDPENSKIYQAVASKTLGFDPTQKVLGNMLSESEKAKAAQIEVVKTNAEFAWKNSIGVVDSTGKPDIEASAKAAQPLLDLQRRAQVAQWEKEISGAGKTKDQIDRADRQSAATALEPVLQSHTSGLINLAVAAASRPEFKNPKTRESIIEAVDQNKAGAMNAANQYFATHVVDPAVQKGYIDGIEARYKPFYDLATGDNSAIAATARQAKELKDRFSVDEATSVPQLVHANNLGLTGAMGGYFSTWLAQHQETGGAVGEAAGKVIMGDLNRTMSVLDGTLDITQMPIKDQTETLRGVTQMLRFASQNPGTANPAVIVNGVNSILKPALTSASERDIRQGAGTVTSPAVIASLRKAMSSGVTGATETAKASLDLTEKALNLNLSFINKNQTQGNRQVKAYFNPMTNQVEITAPKEGESMTGDGGVTIQGPVPRVDKSLLAQVAETNKFLQARLNMKDFQTGRLGNLNDNQLAQFLVDSSGFPTKPGVAKTEYSEQLGNGAKGIRTAVNVTGNLQDLQVPLPTTQKPAETDFTTEFLQTADKANKSLNNASMGITGNTGYDLGPVSAEVTNVKSQIRAEAEAQGVDPALALAFAEKESNFQTNIQNFRNDPKGGFGTFQLIPGTAKMLGVDRTDPAQNIHGGVKYLAQLMKKYNGDLDKVIAEYSGGAAGGDPEYNTNLRKLIEKNRSQ